MTSAWAFAVPAGLVVGLAALRHGPDAGRSPRRPAPANTTTPRAPVWVEELFAATGRYDAVEAWLLLRRAVPMALLAVAVVVGPVAAAALGASLMAAPRAARPAIRRRLHDHRDAQLAGSLERLASALRAGSSPTEAFVAVTHGAPEPLRSDWQGVAAEIEHGAGMAAAIDRWGGRPDATPTVRLAAAALSLGVSAGGEVARSMDRVAATLRERREVQGEVRALATQARASAGVLGVAPFGFTALVSTIDPSVVRFLLTTPAGLLCLGGGLGLEAAGVLWMARIVAAAS
jgi:tight adherence protein B